MNNNNLIIINNTICAIARQTFEFCQKINCCLIILIFAKNQFYGPSKKPSNVKYINVRGVFM